MPATGYPFQMAGGVPVVTAPAEIDTSNAGELRAILFEWQSRGHAVVVDLTGTQFCDSVGLRVESSEERVRTTVPAAGRGSRHRAHACGHLAAGEPHRSNDADGLVRWAGCKPRRYRVIGPGPAAQVRTGLPCNTASPPIPQAASIASAA